jgi:hypothetical protein
MAPKEIAGQGLLDGEVVALAAAASCDGLDRWQQNS